MGKPVQTLIRRILGRKTQRVVDGQVVDVTDRDGNVRRFWTLVWEYLRDNDVVERKVNVFPNHFSGGRDGETMFWKRQDLQGLVNQIQAIQPGQTVELEEKIPATNSPSAPRRWGFFLPAAQWQSASPSGGTRSQTHASATGAISNTAGSVKTTSPNTTTPTPRQTADNSKKTPHISPSLRRAPTARQARSRISPS